MNVKIDHINHDTFKEKSSFLAIEDLKNLRKQIMVGVFLSLLFK